MDTEMINDILLRIGYIMGDIDEADDSENEFWTSIFWDLKDIADKISEYKNKD